MKQYNVVIYGNLTNTNGVLSGFSASNYAVLSKTFNPSSQTALEIVFKFNSNSISDEQIIFQMGNISTANGFIDIEVYNSKLYFELDSENTQRCYIEGVTTLSSNVDYWVKLIYDGVNVYALSLSTDSITWNTEGTVTSWYYLVNAQNSYIGINQDLSNWYFSGGIDLNKSYIKIDNTTWWQGTQNITKIQLRHDTAANWTSVNPILLEGEVGIETDTRKQKFGDGVTAWNSLPYDVGSTALQSITSTDVTEALGYTPYNSSNPDGYTSNVGTVTSVNNIQPDNNGNVSLAIPTVNNATLTIQKNGTTVNAFTANASSDVICNIIVPTAVTDLSDASNYVTSTGLSTILDDYATEQWTQQQASSLYTSIQGWVNNQGYAVSADLADVATTGDYDDLLNKPTIPQAQIQSDWNQTDSSAVDFIKNKPNPTTVDQTYDRTSTNAQSGVAIEGELSTNYQPKLVSGTNIKTINNTSLLGSGNINLDSLPSQTGQSGKFLTTNGSVASWSDTTKVTFRDWSVT